MPGGTQVRTYTTANGEVLDLGQMTADEERYFARALAAYRAEAPWAEFAQLTQGAENPALDQGRMTQASFENAMFQAIFDMETRLMVRQGRLRPSPGWDVERDPFADEEISIVEAAREKGVARQTLYTAIATGDLVGTRERPARVSRNSLASWRPQRARRAG